MLSVASTIALAILLWSGPTGQQDRRQGARSDEGPHSRSDGPPLDGRSLVARGGRRKRPKLSEQTNHLRAAVRARQRQRSDRPYHRPAAFFPGPPSGPL